MNTNKWIEEKINSYLFDTNLRWSGIHGKIMSRIPISVDERKEYEGATDELQDLISKVREEETKRCVKVLRALDKESEEMYRKGIEPHCTCLRYGIYRIEETAKSTNKTKGE